MSCGEDLRAYLVGTTAGSSAIKAVTTRCYQNTVPSFGSTDAGTLPFIWLRRRSVEFLETLGEADNVPYQEFYDFEVVADDIDEADDLAQLVIARLNGAKGTLNSTSAYQWVGVTEQTEDYIPRNQAADEHLHIVSLDVEVINQ